VILIIQFLCTTRKTGKPRGHLTADATVWHMTIHPSGGYLYVAGYFDSVVFQYAVGTSGTLTPMTAATVGSGSGPNSMVTVQK
jgi:hypothetical protein